MRRPGVAQRDDTRLGQLGKIRNLAGMVRAHLDDGVAMRDVEACQHQRHPDVVVEIAGRGKRRANALEDGARHFLERRLAVAAGNADQHDVLAVAPGGTELTQRQLRVGDLDQR